jgi:2-oxoglutarate dehydrogenase complex dehydrogenase (E1) component-like enzyme
MAKKVSVTSVTPASKVKATSKAQQARTRGLVMGIATATPAGKAVKAVASTGKTVRKIKAAQMVKQNKKTVEKVARMQEKTKAEKIAKNSVTTKPANKNNPSNAKINYFTDSSLRKMKSGEYAKDAAKLQEITNKVTQGLNKTKPKVVKINSKKK